MDERSPPTYLKALWAVALVLGVVTLLQQWDVENVEVVREARGLELELFEIEQRQKMVDRELLALSAVLARTNNETWWRDIAVDASRRPQKPSWGAGPPPDKYFVSDSCGSPRWTGSFARYDERSSPACERAAESWRMEPGCPGADGRAAQTPRLRRQVLVTGVQRSGTHFTWEMLNRLGVHVHHEGLGPAGSVSWLYSWRASNFVINNPSPLTPEHRFCVVLHQVRHPLRVVSSIAKATRPRDKFWQWIATVEKGIDNAAPPPIRAAKLWHLQNLRLEKIADARFKVEDTSPRDVCRAAGFDELLCAADGRYHTTSSKIIQPIIEPKPRPKNGAAGEGSNPPSVTWDDLDRLDEAISIDVKAMAQRYGYHLDPRLHPQSLATEAFKA